MYTSNHSGIALLWHFYAQMLLMTSINYIVVTKKKSGFSVNKDSQNLLAFALNRVRFRKRAPFPPQELLFYHFSWIFQNLGTFPMKLL